MKKQSRHLGGLHNNELHPHATFPEVTVQTINHGTYTLEGRLLADESSTASAMYIHGARADYTKADNIFLPLHELGINMLGATVSGHGITGLESDKPFSLDDNLAEALAFADTQTGNPKTIIGLSMGGTTAVRVVQERPGEYSNLVLFYPAVFPDEVYPVPFGTDEFRAIASKKGAFLTSSFFDTIKNFPGKIMLIKGEFDGLNPSDFGKPDENSTFTVEVNGREVYSPIPPEVFTKIREIRPDTVFVEVPGADHQFAKWSQDHKEEAAKLAAKIFEFILAPAR